MMSGRILIGGALVAVTLGALAACGDDGSSSDAPGVSSAAPTSSTSAPATTTSAVPASTEPPLPHVAQLGAEIDLAPGVTVRIAGTDVTVELIDARASAGDCSDCPLQATLAVSNGDQTVELHYSFSGMMEQSALDAARRRHAFELTFMAVRIADDEMTVIVTEGD